MSAIICVCAGGGADPEATRPWREPQPAGDASAVVANQGRGPGLQAAALPRQVHRGSAAAGTHEEPQE